MITLLHAATTEPPALTFPEESDVRELCHRWGRAMAARDPDHIGGMLSNRCVLIPPNGDSVRGADAVVEAWERIFALPGFHLTIEPDRVNLYSTGESAHDIGRYRLSFHADPDAGRSVQDHGSHLLVWERTDGEWRVRSDVFFSQSADGVRLLD